MNLPVLLLISALSGAAPQGATADGAAAVSAPTETPAAQPVVFLNEARAGAGVLDTSASASADTRGNFRADAGIGLGWYLLDHFRLGFELRYTGIFPDGGGGGGQSVDGRVHGELWLPLSEHFAFFAGAFGGARVNDASGTLRTLLDNGKSFVGTFGPIGGVSIFLARNVAFEPTASAAFRSTDFQNPAFELRWHLAFFF